MSALNTQQGGNHYKDLAIQPIEFITKNNIPFIEANVIKYVCRHRNKNKIEDIKKAVHYLEMLLELEYKVPPVNVEVKSGEPCVEDEPGPGFGTAKYALLRFVSFHDHLFDAKISKEKLSILDRYYIIPTKYLP